MRRRSMTRYAIVAIVAIVGAGLATSETAAAQEPATNTVTISSVPPVPGVTVRIGDAESITDSSGVATLSVTTLGPKRPGDPVNVEVDILAKHVERLLATRE